MPGGDLASAPPDAMFHSEDPAQPLHDADLAAALVRSHGIARRVLGCDHLAADAVQEALVALWQLPEPPLQLQGWLVRAVIHRCRHLLRTLRRRRHHEHHAASAHCDLHAGCDNPLHAAYAHELGERLAAAVAGLPAEQRAAFELLEQGELDYAGIARVLDLPIGTVRSRLHRARLALQAAVQEIAAAH